MPSVATGLATRYKGATRDCRKTAAEKEQEYAGASKLRGDGNPDVLKPSTSPQEAAKVARKRPLAE